MNSKSIFSLCAGLCAATLLQFAQAAAPAVAAGPPPAATSADSSLLPGDRAPPAPGSMPGPPPGAGPGGAPGGTSGAGGRPPPEQGTDAPGPSLALAVEAAQAAIAACLADGGYKVSASVIDSTGQPRATLVADGATGGHAYTGVRKGLAALAFKMPTSQVSAKIATDKAMAAMVKPNMMTWAGAVPLLAGGNVIGAIGVSGASSQQDEKCAAAGAAKVASRLK
jgi:uncharacterized protein GlcG (DUF336 family)